MIGHWKKVLKIHRLFEKTMVYLQELEGFLEG